MIAADIPEICLRVDTDRYGPFLFQVGVDAQERLLPMQRVEDAHVRFGASPRSVVRSTVGATNPRSTNATSGTCWRHWSAGTRSWPRRVFTR